MSETPQSLTGGLTDADFRRTILRAIRLTAILTAVGIPLVWWKLGWPSAVYLLVGGAISGSSLWEMLRLMTAVMVRMDVPQAGGPERKPPSLTPVFLGLILHLGIALVMLCVTLKTLDGSVYALAGGFLAGVFALSVEAFRMMRLYTV